jgi:NTE family protein
MNGVKRLKLSAIAVLGFLALTLSSELPGFADDNAAGSGAATPPLAGSLAKSGGNRPRIGLALGGGGSRGAALVGVLKVLTEAGIPIDAVAGTSIGAVVGGLYCAGMPMEELDRRFRDTSLLKAFMTVPLSVRLVAAPVLYMPRLIGHRPYDGLYYGNRFRKYIDNALRKGKRPLNIEAFHTPFAAVVTNLITGESDRLTTGDLGRAVQASTAVPALRKPVEYGENLYCDGGLICNLPTPHVKALGADFIIAVDIDQRVEKAPLTNFRVPGAVAKQAITIDLQDMDRRLGKLADFTIHPCTNGIALISRKKEDAVRGIEAGEQAAREALPELKRKLVEIGAISP